MNWETVDPEKWIPEGYAIARHGGIGSDFVNAWYPLQVTAVQNGLGKYGQIGKISGDYLSGPKTLTKKDLIKKKLF